MTTERDKERHATIGAKLSILGTAFFAALTGDHLIARRFLDMYDKVREVPIEEDSTRAALWGELEDLGCRLVANETELAERTRALELATGLPPRLKWERDPRVAGPLLDEIAMRVERRKEFEEQLAAVIVRLNLVSRTPRPEEP